MRVENKNRIVDLVSYPSKKPVAKRKNIVFVNGVWTEDSGISIANRCTIDAEEDQAVEYRDIESFRRNDPRISHVISESLDSHLSFLTIN